MVEQVGDNLFLDMETWSIVKNFGDFVVPGFLPVKYFRYSIDALKFRNCVIREEEKDIYSIELSGKSGRLDKYVLSMKISYDACVGMDYEDILVDVFRNGESVFHEAYSVFPSWIYLSVPKNATGFAVGLLGDKLDFINMETYQVVGEHYCFILGVFAFILSDEFDVLGVVNMTKLHDAVYYQKIIWANAHLLKKLVLKG